MGILMTAVGSAGIDPGPKRSGRWVVVAMIGLCALGGCGGGGAGGGSAVPGGSTPPAAPAPAPSPAPAPGPGASGASEAELVSASKFVSRTTLGPSLPVIETVAAMGPEAWLEAQFEVPQTVHADIVTRYGERFGFEFASDPGPENYKRFALIEAAITGEDLLRQRVAFALSQIFVVSDRVDLLHDDPYGLAIYWDLLATHAFGNYRDLLEAVTLSPVMGHYLSHANNARSNPATNTFPDENYAREVMQLFSIGLFELNRDGTRRLGSDGAPIPTYSNTDVREYAKIFTGLTWGPESPGDPVVFGSDQDILTTPMVMVDAFHEPGEKRLLGGAVVPAGNTGLEDVRLALDSLFEHPNTGPFIGRLLIQRLVTSNPSPAYVERVARAFEGDATSVRGDMRAVLRAVLLDPEALTPDASTGGKLREPFVRWLGLFRGVGSSSSDGLYPLVGVLPAEGLQQFALSAPSVFNFYLPDYAPPGELVERGLVSPELQITNDSTVVGWPNIVALALFEGVADELAEQVSTDVRIELGAWEAIAGDTDALLDRIGLVFAGGALSPATREVITRALTQLGPDPALRARIALYLALISPDHVVEG